MHTPILPSLVLLPGMDGTGLLFHEFIAALASKTHTLVVDYPTNQVLDYPQLCEYVRARLPTDAPFVILGESFSGPIAISITASAPANMRGLILSCSFAKNPRLALVALTPLLHLMAHNTPSALARWALFGNRCTPAWRQRFDQALSAVSPEVISARLRAIADVDVTADLRRIASPILYLRATRDRVVPRTCCAEIVACARHTEVINVEGPHMLLQTQASRTAVTALGFLERNR